MLCAATVLALLVYLAILLGVGFYTRRRTRAFADYVTGGGTIPAWMLALSFMANFISSNSFVGHAAKSYELGLIWCVVGGVMVVCCALSWAFFAPRFARFARESGAQTLPDFFALRFVSPALAQAVHWIIVSATLFYVLAVMRGTALMVSAGLGISYEVGLALLYGVTLVYSLLGGLWADVSTDVIQAVLLVLGAIGLFLAVAFAPQTVQAAQPLKAAPLGLVLSVGLGGGLKLLADPKQVMVFYAFKDDASVRRFRWLAPLLLLLVYAALFPVGYLSRGLVSSIDDLERLVPILVFDQKLLGSGFSLLFLISLLAASMSSLDSALLVMASCLEKHTLAPRFSGTLSLARTRGALFLVATLAFALSLRPLGGIISLTTFAGALLGATLLPAICVGLSATQVPLPVVAGSVGAGVVGALFGKLAPLVSPASSPWVQDVFCGLLASSAVVLVWWGSKVLRNQAWLWSGRHRPLADKQDE